MQIGVSMVKMIVTDVDGVLTDGKIAIDTSLKSIKKLCFRDFDVRKELWKDSIKLGIITGENDTFSDYVNEKFCPDYFFGGCKQKKEALLHMAETEKLSLAEICYIGDSWYDVEAMKIAGIGIAPKDADNRVRAVADIVLEISGGEGCFAAAYDIVKARNDIATVSKCYDLMSVFEEHKQILEWIEKDLKIQQNIQKSIALFVKVLENDNRVFFCGNGGSAADAQHLTAELVGRFYKERRALNAEALTVNTSVITAIGNDYDYTKVFARQVEAKGRAGDVLIGITTSGMAENVITALKKAKESGMHTIMMTGDAYDKKESFIDIAIVVPSRCTARIQEMHILIGHIICQFVEESICTVNVKKDDK